MNRVSAAPQAAQQAGCPASGTAAALPLHAGQPCMRVSPRAGGQGRQRSVRSTCGLRCRHDGAKNSSQLILNLLELMAEQGVERSQETYDLLLSHWTSRRIFKAVLATAEDMAAAGLTPDPQQIRTAVFDADTVRCPLLCLPVCSHPCKPEVQASGAACARSRFCL